MYLVIVCWLRWARWEYKYSLTDWQVEEIILWGKGIFSNSGGCREGGLLAAPRATVSSAIFSLELHWHCAVNCWGGEEERK